jgi:hypothetical protein
VSIDEQEIRHGYTLRDLDRLARIAVRIANLHSLPAQDRYDEALSAIGLHLAAADQPPTERELKAAGARAINDMHEREDKHHGVSRYRAKLGDERVPRYHTYWALTGVTPSHENSVVDRVALEQIWPALSPMQRAALTAYAEHEDHTAAMAAVGVASGTYKTHLKRGRDKVFALWHEGETPSSIWFASRGGGSPLGRALAARRWYRAHRGRAA